MMEGKRLNPDTIIIEEPLDQPWPPDTVEPWPAPKAIYAVLTSEV